jgi:hypothetical protein
MEIQLTFAWPDGLAVRVEQDRTVVDEVEGRPTRYRSRNTFVLVRQGQTVWVRDHDRVVLESTPAPPGVFDHQPLLRFLQECAPSFVIDAAGQVTGLAPGAADEVRRAVAPPPAVAAAQPAIAGAVARLTTDAALRVGAESVWNPLVALFAGGVVRPGAPVVVGYEAPLAILPTLVPYQLTVEATVEPDGDVTLTSRSRPSPEPLRRALEAVATPGLGGARLVRFEPTTDVVLRCDPATMIPRWAESVQRTVAESTAGETRHTQVTEDRRTLRCTVVDDA